MHVTYTVPPLPEKTLTRAVRTLQDSIPYIQVPKLRRDILADPGFWVKNHFGFGMTIRNMLRTKSGIPEKSLPTGNWDDYYIRVVETFLGIDGKEADGVLHESGV